MTGTDSGDESKEPESKKRGTVTAFFRLLFVPNWTKSEWGTCLVGSGFTLAIWAAFGLPYSPPYNLALFMFFQITAVVGLFLSEKKRNK